MMSNFDQLTMALVAGLAGFALGYGVRDLISRRRAKSRGRGAISG